MDLRSITGSTDRHNAKFFTHRSVYLHAFLNLYHIFVFSLTVTFHFYTAVSDKKTNTKIFVIYTNILYIYTILLIVY